MSKDLEYQLNIINEANDGTPIEYRLKFGKWRKIDDIKAHEFNFHVFEYRVKPDYTQRKQLSFIDDFENVNDADNADIDFKFYHDLWKLANRLNKEIRHDGKSYHLEIVNNDNGWIIESKQNYHDVTAVIFLSLNAANKAIKIIKKWHWYWNAKNIKL